MGSGRDKCCSIRAGIWENWTWGAPKSCNRRSIYGMRHTSSNYIGIFGFLPYLLQFLIALHNSLIICTLQLVLLQSWTRLDFVMYLRLSLSTRPNTYLDIFPYTNHDLRLSLQFHVQHFWENRAQLELWWIIIHFKQNTRIHCRIAFTLYLYAIIIRISWLLVPFNDVSFRVHIRIAVKLDHNRSEKRRKLLHRLRFFGRNWWLENIWRKVSIVHWG